MPYTKKALNAMSEGEVVGIALEMGLDASVEDLKADTINRIYQAQKAPKPEPEQAKPDSLGLFGDVDVRITAKNCWTSRGKAFEGDVVNVSADDADLLLANNQAELMK